MDRYLAQLKMFREKRNEIISEDIIFLNKKITELFLMEKEIKKLVKSFNRCPRKTNTNLHIECHIEYTKQSTNNKYMAIKRIRYKFMRGSVCEKYLISTDRWERLIKRTTLERKIKLKNDRRKQINKTVKRYLKLGSAITLIVNKILSIAEHFKQEMPRSLWREDWLYFDFPRRMDAFSHLRSRQLAEACALMLLLGDKFNTVEQELGDLVGSFNGVFAFDGGGLAYSWLISEKRNPMLNISGLKLWRVHRPIDERGVRRRYKRRVKALTRDFIRNEGFKRHSNKIRIASKNINEKIKLWQQLKKTTVSVNRQLKLLTTPGKKHVKCNF